MIFEAVATQVEYAKLGNYLNNTILPIGGVLSIEVMGDIPLNDFKPEGIFNQSKLAGELSPLFGQTKVAVKINKYPSEIKDMKGTFNKCKRLVYLANLPEGVTNLEECFNECEELKFAPPIPSTVTNMTSCFKGV